MFSSLLVVLAFIACWGVATPGLPKRPNIILIITDDQDVHLSSLDYMPITMKQLRDVGTTFKKHYCTIALCCPSRVSLLTGKAAHNTNVTDVAPPYGTSLCTHVGFLNGAGHLIISVRRLSKVHPAGSQRKLSSCLAPRWRLRHLLYRKTHECSFACNME